MEPKTIFPYKKQFATRNIAGELVLVPVRENVARMTELFTLNEVGAFIWEQIDSQSTTQQLVEAIVANFDVEPALAQRDLEAFLQKLVNTLKLS